MLRNSPIRPVRGDSDRRWLSDEYFDLIVWYDPSGAVSGFQLCYDKPRFQRALTWRAVGGFTHDAIDAGESKATAQHTPILVDDGEMPVDEVWREFLSRSRLLPEDMRHLVLEKLAEYEREVG